MDGAERSGWSPRMDQPKKPDPPPPFLTVEDVAKFLNAPESWVRLAAKQGRIPAYKLGQQFRFKFVELEAWMQAHKVSYVLDAHPPPPAPPKKAKKK